MSTDNILNLNFHGTNVIVKEASPDKGYISGYAAKYTIDSVSDKFLDTAFDNVLEKIRFNNISTPIAVGHDQSKIIGEIPSNAWVYKPDGLYFEDAYLDLNNPIAKEHYLKMKDNVDYGLSVFVHTKNTDLDKNDARAHVIKNVRDIKEVSITRNPANKDAYVTHVKESTKYLYLKKSLDELRLIIMKDQLSSLRNIKETP